MAYSNDLRKRVIAAVEAGGQTLSQVAKTFQVSESTVDKWMQRRREIGSTQALPWAGGKRRALARCEACIRAAVRRQPDISLQELCEHVTAETGVVANSSMMSRELALLKLPRKKRVSTTASATRRGSARPGKRLPN
jgi:transposase